MTTRIERTVTDVVPTPEPPAPAEARSTQVEIDRVRRALARAERIAERTRAEGFDD